jgi:hypothetical protein
MAHVSSSTSPVTIDRAAAETRLGSELLDESFAQEIASHLSPSKYEDAVMKAVRRRVGGSAILVPGGVPFAAPRGLGLSESGRQKVQAALADQWERQGPGPDDLDPADPAPDGPVAMTGETVGADRPRPAPSDDAIVVALRTRVISAVEAEIARGALGIERSLVPGDEAPAPGDVPV